MKLTNIISFSTKQSNTFVIKMEELTDLNYVSVLKM